MNDVSALGGRRVVCFRFQTRRFALRIISAPGIALKRLLPRRCSQ